MADVPMKDSTKPGFLAYKPEHLRKINSMREASSMVYITTSPTLEKGQVLFSSAANSHDEPRSCYNCFMFNRDAKTCKLMGPAVRVEKFIYPPTGTEVAKRIEYWPACGMWAYGTPIVGKPVYKELPFDEPDDLGFGWINAPVVGQPHGGANCGGTNGGDDCDNFIVAGDDKRASPTGFCRVLRQDVENGACCTAWGDDDFISWQKGQDLLKDLDKQRVGVAGPNPLLPK